MCHSAEPPQKQVLTPTLLKPDRSHSSQGPTCTFSIFSNGLATLQANRPQPKSEAERKLPFQLSLVCLKEKEDLRFLLYWKPAQLDRRALVYLPNQGLQRKWAEDHHSTWTQIFPQRCPVPPQRMFISVGTEAAGSWGSVRKMITSGCLWGL